MREWKYENRIDKYYKYDSLELKDDVSEESSDEFVMGPSVFVDDNYDWTTTLTEEEMRGKIEEKIARYQDEIRSIIRLKNRQLLVVSGFVTFVLLTIGSVVGRIVRELDTSETKPNVPISHHYCPKNF